MAYARRASDGVTTQFNILFTSAGRRVSLIRSFRTALSALGLSGRLITTDLRRHAPAAFVGDEHIVAPPVTAPGYVDFIKAVCRKHDVQLIVPLIDTELHLLSPHRGQFGDFGITLLSSSTEVNEICLDKRLTAAFFAREGFDAPRIVDGPSLLGDAAARYPFFLKPSDGSCSVGATRINNRDELAFFMSYVPNALVQEHLDGQEYTLDVLADLQGKVRCVVPRLRIETRAGEVSKGMTVQDPRLIEVGRRVVEALPGAFGCLTVQCFLTPAQEIKLTEINPRFGGGFPLAYEAGADFPRWIIEMLLGRATTATMVGWRDDVVMLRYDDAIFVRKNDIS
jgi:carbamoyl-phosphate synthase large subunit